MLSEGDDVEEADTEGDPAEAEAGETLKFRSREPSAAASQQQSRITWLQVDSCMYQRLPPKAMQPRADRKHQTNLAVPTLFLRTCYPHIEKPCPLNLEIEVPSGAAAAKARSLVREIGGTIPDIATTAGPSHGSTMDSFAKDVVTVIKGGKLSFRRRSGPLCDTLEKANTCVLKGLGEQLAPFRKWRLVGYRKVRWGLQCKMGWPRVYQEYATSGNKLVISLRKQLFTAFSDEPPLRNHAWHNHFAALVAAQ
jgi:hypothetical protein